MPVDTTGIQTISVPVAAAVDFARRAYVAVGVPEEDAQRAAAALVDADVQGISTHGIKNLSGYVRAVRAGKVNPRPDIRRTGGSGALVRLTGDSGLGHVAAYHGMQTAIDLAREHGVGSVFVSHSNHYGASGYWARLAVKAGMGGFAFTNAVASIAPWGGTAPFVGNNPPAWAVPTFSEDDVAKPHGGADEDAGVRRRHGAGTAAELGYDMPDSIYLDMALSVVAGNRLDIYARRGLPIPPGWALDKDGNPSTDARVRSKGGTFAPIAEYKGFGLALLLSLFTSVLAGGQFDDEQLEATRAGSQTNRSHWFMALDIRRLVPPEPFGQRVREVAARVRSAPRKQGVDALHAPGDMERTRARRQMAEGVAYEPFILDDLKALAEQLDIPLGI